MWRALWFLLVAVIILAAVWWVGTLPGDVVAHVGRLTIETSTPAALLILFVVAAIFTVFIRVIGGLRRAPGQFGGWRGGRRQRLGDVATQRAIVALAAGDVPAARVEAGRAQTLIGEAPLVLLVKAEAARLSGDDETARVNFEKLSKNKDMAFLGHHGLIRHRMGQGAYEAAHEHALAAQDAYPGSAWLRTKRLEIAVKKSDWAGALALTTVPHEVAALAAAAAGEAGDPAQAAGFAKRALKADPGSTPAVLAYAAALTRRGKPRAARKALLAGWKTAPQPDVAAAFLATYETPLERAKAAGALAAAAPGDAESELVQAQTALAAQLPGEARRHALAAEAAGMRDGRAATVLAALGDRPAAPAGDKPALPLGDRPAAPLGDRPAGPVGPPVWHCAACHDGQTQWAPVCLHCGAIGRLVWRRPGTALVAVSDRPAA
jgi:HemY protein